MSELILSPKFREHISQKNIYSKEEEETQLFTYWERKGSKQETEKLNNQLFYIPRETHYGNHVYKRNVKLSNWKKSVISFLEF